MPKQDSPIIDTQQFGLATDVNTPSLMRKIHPMLFEIKFDTGVVMYVPPNMVENMMLHLQEGGPKW